jgi:ABC-type sugar transport system ATPase subunit
MPTIEEMNREEILDELQRCLEQFDDNNRKMQAAVKELQANARQAVEQAKEMRRLLDHPL